jgi:D-tyrosyl-tRNA(Tyr) deacylase
MRDHRTFDEALRTLSELEQRNRDEARQAAEATHAEPKRDDAPTLAERLRAAQSQWLTINLNDRGDNR